MKKIRWGIFFTYMVLFINTASGIFLTPFMIRSLGEVEYSIYQLVMSFSGYLLVVNMGTGVAMNRFVSVYRAKEDKEGEQKYIFINLLITLLLMLIVLVVGIVIHGGIAGWFPNIVTSKGNESLIKKLCIIVVTNVMISFLSNAFAGLLQAYGEIDFTTFFSLVRLILRIVLIVIFLKMGMGAIMISVVDGSLNVMCLILELIMLYKKYHFRLKFKSCKIDTKLLRETLFFSVASLLSALSGQLNHNIDKTILALYCSSFEMTVYSVATTFYTMFTSFGSCLNNVFLNKVTELCCKNDKDNTELELLNIKIGRFQNVLIGAVFWGFVCVGRDFINAWMGIEYSEIFMYALLLIIPNYFVCISGVQETILDAKNKKMVKSVIVCLIGVLNVILTVFLVKKYGGIGTSIGTMIALFLGYDICLNIYMHKVIKVNVVKMFAKIIKGYLAAQLITVICSLIIYKVFNLTVNGTWLRFIEKGIIFVGIYIVVVWIVGFNNYEKDTIKSFFKREKQEVKG